MPLSDALRTRLTNIVSQHRVVLFMKGNRRMPQCGFSASVVGILDELIPTYETFDVFSDQAVRDGMKEFSEWPTFPQLYIDGKFIGGADIVREMHGSGDLGTLLGAEAAATVVPTITLSEAAAGAFREALADAGDDKLRFEVSPRFESSLFFGPADKADVVVHAAGVELYLDRASARRAEGVKIDFVAGEGGGFKIENPNEPPKVKQISVQELKAMMDAKEKFELVDVRTDKERAIAVIPGARPWTQETQGYLTDLDKGAKVVFHCHHGMRSQAAAEQFLALGYTNVYNVRGGIDAWSSTVDPSVARY